MIRLVRVHIQITFEATGVVSRSWGPTLRGGFGIALRDVSCSLRRPSCDDCRLNGVCAYGYLFETPINPSSAIMRKYPHAPHPFVFEPPEDPIERVLAGTTQVLSLVLIGKASEYMPFILLALESLGRKGLGRDRVPFRVEAIRAEDGKDLFRASVRSQIANPLLKAIPLEPGSPCVARFSLLFRTPTRIQANGAISRSPKLIDVVANLRRRLFLLRYFHDDGSVHHLAPAFLQAAKEARVLESHFCWTDNRRQSSRQHRRVPIGGVIGRMACEGDLGILRPLLLAGEYVHVGKNTAFGLGRYELVAETLT